MECTNGNDKAVFCSVVDRALAFDPGGWGFELRQGQIDFFFFFDFVFHNS